VSKTTKRFIWFAIGILVLVVLLLPRLLPREGATAAVPVEEATALTVQTQVVAPRRLEERLATTGTIRADEMVELRSEISGTIETIFFGEGARVETGEILLKLDDAELAAVRDRAQHRLKLAELREARQQDLLTQGLTSQEDYDLAFSQLSVFQAEVRLAEVELEKTEIRAPFRGILGFRYVSKGSALNPQTRIATLQKIDSVKIEFSMPERYAGKVHLNDTVHFRVKSSEESYEGVIYAIEPAVDFETRSLRARARCSNPAGVLMPGAFADVELVVNEIEGALTVPAMAVIPELGGKKVFVFENGEAMPRVVETGLRTEDAVQIVRGLNADDRVIISGIQQLRPGLTVTLADSSATP
jgi:membrane fusion protein (multidrug efflux system)